MWRARKHGRWITFPPTIGKIYPHLGDHLKVLTGSTTNLLALNATLTGIDYIFYLTTPIVATVFNLYKVALECRTRRIIFSSSFVGYGNTKVSN
ncbi:MAG: hypothetical protein LBV77_06435 [Candidatus Adiutrix intracellularis]|nr:hypothetical protein [Candidatus Adiutrix intracellularis]